MKKIALFLILISITFCLFSENIVPPTDEKIAEVIEKSPEKVYEMIKKLYILEHIKPIIYFPEMRIIILKDESARVEYTDMMKITIGTENRNLLYDIELKPKDVIIARDVPASERWGWGVFFTTLAFLVGFLSGNLAAR